MQQQLRIASLLAAGTEILYGLGLGHHVVAISHECDWPPEVASKPHVTFSAIEAHASSAAIDQQVREMMATGGPLYTIDEEALAALAPDLIVTQSQCDVCSVRYEDVVALVRSQSVLCNTRIVDLNPQSLSDVLEDVLRVSRAAGDESTGISYVAELRKRVEAIHEKTRNLPISHRPRVACIEWTEPLMLAGNWVPELVEIAGGTNGLTQSGQHSPYIPWSSVVEFDPQVIVVCLCGFDLERTALEAAGLRELAGWSNVAAVRDGRVYLVDGNAYLNRSSPRLVDSLELLSHLFHPDLFPEPLLRGPTAWQHFHT